MVSLGIINQVCSTEIKKENGMDKILLTPREVGKITGISANTIRKMCKDDPEFPSFMNGSHHKISRAGLEMWVEQQCQKVQSLKRA